MKRRLPTNGGVQEVKLIPEGDLYRLIISSKLPQAEKFERWVFDEVLPSIRRSGGYIGNVEEIIAKTATAVVSEVMKQIIPLLRRNNTYYNLMDCMRIEEMAAPKPRRKYAPSKISMLDVRIRQTSRLQSRSHCCRL